MSIKTARRRPAKGDPPPNSIVAIVEPKDKEQLLKLSTQWAADPQAYFRPWCLKDLRAESDCIPVNEHASPPAPASAESTSSLNDRCSPKKWLWHNLSQMRKMRERSVEVSLRQILCAIFFYDVVTAQSRRRKEDSGLPTGAMPGLVRQAWTRLTEEELDDETTSEVVNYVKEGYRHHLVCKAAGAGSWLLFPEQVLLAG